MGDLHDRLPATYFSDFWCFSNCTEFLANFGVFISLLMAKFLQDTSLIILFFLSIADICIALVTQTRFAVLIGRFFDQICTLDIIAQFFALFLTHVSGYGIACIGFDVYARMCFPKRHNLMVAKKILFAALTFICLISFFSRNFYALGTQYNVFEYASKVVLGIESGNIPCNFNSHFRCKSCQGS